METDLLRDPTVQVHGWIFGSDGESKHHTDKPDPEIDGYCVYLRSPTGPGGEFVMKWEMDFLNKEAALSYAAGLARKHKTIIEFY